MADAFIGFTILITLQYPPNAQLQGVVANVLDQKLFLRDGMLIMLPLHPSCVMQG